MLAALSLSACTSPNREAAVPQPPLAPPPLIAASSCSPSSTQVGLASWYGEGFHLKHTASGEPFDMNDLTAAHRWLPLNTVVRVTNLDNGRSAVLRINDRGPYIRGRTLDVSRYAAAQLGMKGNGLAHVRIDVYDLEGQEGADTAALEPADDAPRNSRGHLLAVTPDAHFPIVGSLVSQP